MRSFHRFGKPGSSTAARHEAENPWKRQGNEFCKDVHGEQGTPGRVSNPAELLQNSHAGQAPRACTGRAGPAPAPRNSPKSTKPAQSLQSCAFFNTKPNPLGFQTMWWIFAVMLKYFHPVIKSPPIHRLQHSLEIPTFEESIFPAHPTQECILSWAHTQPFGTRAVKCLRTLGEGSKYSDR